MAESVRCVVPQAMTACSFFFFFLQLLQGFDFEVLRLDVQSFNPCLVEVGPGRLLWPPTSER